MREDKFSVKDKRDLCRYHKASQFCEVADIAYFTIYLYRNYKLKKYIVLKKDRYTLFSLLVLGIVIGLYYTKNIYLCLLGLVIAIFYSYYLNKSFIKLLIKKLKRKKE